MSPDTPDTTEVEPEMARRCPVCETVFTAIYPFSRQVFCSPTCKVQPQQQTGPVELSGLRERVHHDGRPPPDLLLGGVPRCCPQQ